MKHIDSEFLDNATKRLHRDKEHKAAVYLLKKTVKHDGINTLYPVPFSKKSVNKEAYFELPKLTKYLRRIDIEDLDTQFTQDTAEEYLVKDLLNYINTKKSVDVEALLDILPDTLLNADANNVENVCKVSKMTLQELHATITFVLDSGVLLILYRPSDANWDCIMYATKLESTDYLTETNSFSSKYLVSGTYNQEMLTSWKETRKQASKLIKKHITKIQADANNKYYTRNGVIAIDTLTKVLGLKEPSKPKVVEQLSLDI